MASIGMKKLQYAVMDDDGTYGTAKVMGAAISADVSLNIAEASLYGDDQMIEYASSFQSATVSLETDEDDSAIFSELLGKTHDTTSGIVTSSVSDAPPYVGFGYIVTKVIKGVRKWRAQFFHKIQFRPFVPAAATKGESLTFQTITVEGTSIPNADGIWEAHVDVDTEAEALAALTNFFTPTTTP